jgi:hypothetical protein
MREPGSTPSLVPSNNATVYLVLDDFGKLGRAYRETDENRANIDTVVQDFLNGEFKRPVRVVAFNIAEGWSRDASEDISWKLIKRAAAAGEQLTDTLRDFVHSHVGEREVLEA